MERMLPSNTEAEQGVLGSIIIDPEAIVQVADFLLPDDFYRDAHRTLYETILELYEHSEPADFITICDELERRDRLEQVGGASYITSLINQVPTSGNVEYYGRIVERTAVQRRLIHAAGEIAASVYETDDADVAVQRAQKIIFEVGRRTAGKAIVGHRQAITQYMEMLNQLHEEHEEGALTGLPTGFVKLNTLLGGFRKSKSYILAARPGDGKTSMAMNFLDAIVKSGGNALFFSLEMDINELMERWVGMNAPIDTTKLRDGRLNDDYDGRTDWDRVIAAHDRLMDIAGKLWIDDTPGNTITAMHSKAMRLHAQSPLDFIVVDYLQLVRVEERGARKLENRRLEVEEVSRELKNLSRNLDVPVLSLAQLNREIENRANRRPKLSDLREAGGIEQDCDVAMFIYKNPDIPEEKQDYEISIILEKNRSGPKGEVPLRFVGSQTRYYPIDRRYADE